MEGMPSGCRYSSDFRNNNQTIFVPLKHHPWFIILKIVVFVLPGYFFYCSLLPLSPGSQIPPQDRPGVELKPETASDLRAPAAVLPEDVCPGLHGMKFTGIPHNTTFIIKLISKYHWGTVIRARRFWKICATSELSFPVQMSWGRLSSEATGRRFT